MGILSITQGYRDVKVALAGFVVKHANKPTSVTGKSTLLEEMLLDAKFEWRKPKWVSAEQWPPTTLEEIVAYLKTDYVWVGGAVIQLATFCFGVEFYILSSDGAECDVPPAEVPPWFRPQTPKRAVLAHIKLDGKGHHYMAARVAHHHRSNIETTAAANAKAVEALNAQRTPAIHRPVPCRSPMP